MLKKSPNLWVGVAILTLPSFMKIKRGWQNQPRSPQTVYFISFYHYKLRLGIFFFFLHFVFPNNPCKVTVTIRNIGKAHQDHWELKL